MTHPIDRKFYTYGFVTVYKKEKEKREREIKEKERERETKNERKVKFKQLGHNGILVEILSACPSVSSYGGKVIFS